MNRYNRGPTIGGPSKATASTTCQKCLKKGHYSYECKAVVQERPYVSRPSRTQQLLNPKLVPKLTSDVPQDLLRKKGVADEQLAKIEQERGRKRDRRSEDPETRRESKRMRSASSVSSISTRSPSPRQTPREVSHSPPPRSRQLEEKKRRRDSMSSVDSYNSVDNGRERHERDSRERTSSRSTRRKFQQHSPPARGRQSRSPEGDRRRRLSNNRQRIGSRPPAPPPRRERSLSPFSKRIALTQAMNTAQ